VVWSPKHRAAALAISSAALLVSAGSATATTPTADSWTVHIERPFADCPGFSVVGVWDITHKLTLYLDSEGTATRDTERVDFVGQLVNTSTGASVADSGTRIFFDTLAPDGSFLTTEMVQVRKSTYVHSAGRIDFQTGDFRGRNGLDSAGIAALCGALGA
jgi:hypothetical protein